MLYKNTLQQGHSSVLLYVGSYLCRKKSERNKRRGTEAREGRREGGKEGGREGKREGGREGGNERTHTIIANPQLHRQNITNLAG